MSGELLHPTDGVYLLISVRGDKTPECVSRKKTKQKKNQSASLFAHTPKEKKKQKKKKSLGFTSESIKNFFHLSLDQYAGSLPVHLLHSGGESASMETPSQGKEKLSLTSHAS